MERVGFILKVKPELVEEYKRHHQAVWPDMIAALRRHGWHNYSLYMRDDGLLFGYVETAHGFKAALAGMAGEEVNARWQEFMKPYFVAIGGARADEMMQQLEEVFHME